MVNEKEGINYYIQGLINTNPTRLQNRIRNPKGAPYPKRHFFVKIKKYADDFMNGNKERRWVIIPGFRGVGKTTLLAQTYFYFRNNYKQIKSDRIIYMSLDSLKDIGASLSEVLDVYFELLGIRAEILDSPVVLLLDEVQYDSDWARVLKTVWDKTNNIFIICSGSSAISLQTNPDSARRSIIEKLYPVSFSEFLMIKHRIYPKEGMKSRLKSAIYYSKNAEESYSKLKVIEAEAKSIWSKSPKFAQLEYLQTGTFPFAVSLRDNERNKEQEQQIYEMIDQVLDKIIQKDIPSLGRFNANTLGLIKRLLYIVAESDTISFNKLEQLLPIDRATLINVFDVLEKAELIIKIPAYGLSSTGARKPTKYLFMSPAIRQTLMSIAGLPETLRTREGKLIEDIFGLHFYREFLSQNVGTVTYDSAQSSADFVLQLVPNKQIAIEVGRGYKDNKQLLNTMKKIKCDYGLSFSKSELSLFKDENIVQIPSYYLLLM